MEKQININKEEFEKLVKTALENPGVSKGDVAKKKIEIYKTYTEFKRNSYLFWNTIILSIIAITNLAIQLIKLICE